MTTFRFSQQHRTVNRLYIDMDQYLLIPQVVNMEDMFDFL
jgi:hypothetical protein